MAGTSHIFKQGAEAKLYVCTYLGQPTLIKERFRKGYRHHELDATITKERIKNEARTIARCKTAGVKTPTLYLVDFERSRIYMQHFVQSVTAKDFIINFSKKEMGSGEATNSLDKITKMIGETVRKLHDNNIIHGDLTTSNMLLVPKTEIADCDNINWAEIDVELVMIDFGLSHVDNSTENKGVDLYVLERALISTHNDYPELFEKILEAYKNFNKNSKNIATIIKKFEEVRARGRKRTMVG